MPPHSNCCYSNHVTFPNLKPALPFFTENPFSQPFIAEQIQTISGVYQGSMYYLSQRTPLEDVHTFNDHCKKMGGFLAEINSESEYDFIVDFLTQQVPDERSRVILGATDQGHEGRWMYIYSGQPVTFFSWYGDEGDFKDEEDCMFIVWNDVDAGMHQWFCHSQDYSRAPRYLCEVHPGKKMSLC